MPETWVFTVDRANISKIEDNMSILKAWAKRVLPTELVDRYQLKKWYISQIQNLPSVPASIEQISRRWSLEEMTGDERPIFIFASCWRSGSTLLQRLINSDSNVLLWGEPFSNCNFIPDLADSVRALGDHYPSSKNFIDSDNFDKSNAQLSQRWTANLYPEINDLVQAHRQFFHTLFGAPAYRRGYKIWGLKEVRLSIDHAIYLRWLFPHAKFIFLYRNPYKAYRSCRSWPNLYMHYPDQGVYSPQIFGQYWQNMTAGYIDSHAQVEGKVIKYEDFCSEGYPLLEELSDYLELGLQREVLTYRIGSNRKSSPIPRHELKELRKSVEPLASQLGYFPD